MTTKIDGTLGIVMPDNTVRASLAMIAGGFKNLQASANGISANVSITADKIALEDTNFNPIVAQNVNLTLNTAASGANGLDTGTLAASTWYSIWVISNGSTVAALASLSATAPTMPSGYTFKARVGWLRTDASGNKYPLNFVQFGRKVQYGILSTSNVTTFPVVASGTPPGSITSISLSNVIPSTASKINGSAVMGGSTGAVISLYSTSDANSVFLNSSQPATSTLRIPFETLNLAQAIYWSGAVSGSVSINGWEDNI